MKSYVIALAALSMSFVSGMQVPDDDVTEQDCGGCGQYAYAKLDYGGGLAWADPAVTQLYVNAGTMTITNITGPEADGQCHCHYGREDENSPWVLEKECHQKEACTASITVEATPAVVRWGVHVDIDGTETASGVAASATATATGCGDPKVTKTIKFEGSWAGADLGGVSLIAGCGKCVTTCPDPPNGD